MISKLFTTLAGGLLLALTACEAPTSSNAPAASNGLIGKVTTFAGAAEPDYINAVGANARFHDPIDLVAVGTNLYVSDSTNRRIRKIDLGTGLVSTFAFTGDNDYVDGPLLTASTSPPYGITTDGTSLFFTEILKNRIRQVNLQTGQVSTLAGSASGNAGSINATGLQASFDLPSGITTDGVSVFVCDSWNNQIRRINIATAAVTLFAGQTNGGQGAANGTGAGASFHTPQAIANDGTNLYVADTGNHVIRKIVIATGVVTTLAGVNGNPGLVDAFGDTAKFNKPTGLAVKGPYLYVTEENNHTVRRIVISSGEVTTVAGSTAQTTSVDGLGTAAGFDRLFGITAVGEALYLVDSSNTANTIRKIE